MEKDLSLVSVEEESGQLSFLDPEENYYPVSSDYAKIPNRFVERFGNISYVANLGLMLAITMVEERKHEMFKGTFEGQFLEDVFQKTGTDYSEGLVAEIPISVFLKTFNLNRGGRTYKIIDTLYNGELLRNQWQIMYEDKDIIASTAVIIGTMYNKKNNKMYMKFNPDLAPVITNIKSNYAMLSLPVLGKLKDDFVSTLYQVLKRRLDYEHDRNKKYGMPESKEVKIIFDLDLFYFEMGLFPQDLSSKDRNMQQVIHLLKNKNYKMAAEIERESGLIDKYETQERTKERGREIGFSRKAALNDFNYFKGRCLDKAFKRINGFIKPKGLEKVGNKASGEAYEAYGKMCTEYHPTDIHFRYELVRSGLGGKVTSIVFYVSKGQWEEAKANTVAEAAAPAVDEMEFLLSMRDVIREKIAAKDLMAIASAAEWDMDRIKKAYKVASEQSPDDLVAFMISAIRADWDPVGAGDEEEDEAEGFTSGQLMKKYGLDELSAEERGPAFDKALDTFIGIMADFFNSGRKTVKISRSNVEADKVRERLSELEGKDIIAAVEAFLKARPKAVTENYILTILYNIKNQENLRQAHKAHKELEKPVESYPMDKIKELFKYDDIMLMSNKYKDEIDSIFNFIYDALNTDEEQIRIGKGNIPASAVRNRILKLDAFDVIAATRQIVTSGKSETVTRNYVLTILYQIHDQEQIKLAKALHADDEE